MKKSFLSRLMLGTAALATVFISLTARAVDAGYTGWDKDGDNWYWYENGVLQGYDAENPAYRGKEIYDPDSDGWYWLDNVQGGRRAVGKDVYQESLAGDWGDIYGNDGLKYGKWVRYDANGKMVKGWQITDAGTYYFDLIYGTMAKGYATIEGQEYYFNVSNGMKEQELGAVPEGNGWKTINGSDYWYEDGVRQGYSVDASYRGKEIYDPGTDAWYWLDNVDGGKKATNKDVYQESQADDAGTMGKWVRYDADGHMIKGWCAGKGTDAVAISSPSEVGDADLYYFDPIYGTMAKGLVLIDGKAYLFDAVTGICEKDNTQDQNESSWSEWLL